MEYEPLWGPTIPHKHKVLTSSEVRDEDSMQKNPHIHLASLKPKTFSLGIQSLIPRLPGLHKEHNHIILLSSATHVPLC
jgi:hypothetical protein